MKQKLTLVNSALVYTIGTLLLKGINFFTLPIFTNLLTTTDYGITVMYTTWSGLFSILIGLGINGTVGVAKSNLEEEEYKEYLSSTLFLSTISFIIILFLYILFKNQFNYVIQISDSLLVIMIIQSFFSFVINFLLSIYTFEKEAKKYLYLSLLTTILNVIISIIWVISLNTDRYLGKIYGSAIVTISFGIIIYFNILIKGKKLICFKYWKYCLPIAIPIIFHNLSHLILNQVDRVMLQQWTNSSLVGIYSFTYNIGVMVNIIHMSINSAWVAWYFDALKEKMYAEIRDKVKIYIIIFTFFTAMFLLGSPEVIKLLSPKEYWIGIQLLPLIIIGYYFVFLYTFAVNYEFYIKKTSIIAIGSIVAAIMNILVNIIMIPKIGVSGAAVATMVAYFTLFIIHEFIVRVIFKHKDFPFKYYINSILIIFIITNIVYLFLDKFIIRWSILIILLLIIVILGIELTKRQSNKIEFQEI